VHENAKPKAPCVSWRFQPELRAIFPSTGEELKPDVQRYKSELTTFGRGSLGWWLDEERGKPR